MTNKDERHQEQPHRSGTSRNHSTSKGNTDTILYHQQGDDDDHNDHNSNINMSESNKGPLHMLSTLRNKSLLDETISGKLPPSKRDARRSHRGRGNTTAHHSSHWNRTTHETEESDVNTQVSSEVFQYLKEDDDDVNSFKSTTEEEEEDVFDGIEASIDQDNENVDPHHSDSDDSMSSTKVSVCDVHGGNVTSNVLEATLLRRSIRSSMGDNRPQQDSKQGEACRLGTNNSHSVHRNEKRQRDDFVRSGTHFRSLLKVALDKVTTGYTCSTNAPDSTKKRRLMNDSDDDDDDDDYSGEGHNHPTTKNKHDKSNHVLTTLAQEQQHEILQLRQKLSSSESNATALTHANEALRSTSNQAQSNIQRLHASLKVASQKAANAQADADAAKVKADGLEMEMKALEEKIKEFTNVSVNIRMEHDEMEKAVKEMETKVGFMEKELGRCRVAKEKAEKEYRELKQKAEGMVTNNRKLEEELRYKEQQLEKMNNLVIEKEDIDRSKEKRARELEREVRDARSILIEMTSAAADTQSAVNRLQETIGNLQKENTRLHNVIQESSESTTRERVELQEALFNAEAEKQKLRTAVAANEEEIERFKLDKSTYEKEIEQLKHRIIILEKNAVDEPRNIVPPKECDHNTEASSKDKNMVVANIEQCDTSETASMSPATEISDLTHTPDPSAATVASCKTLDTHSSDLAMASSVASEFSYKTPAKKFSIPSLKSSQSKMGERIEHSSSVTTGLTDPFKRILPRHGTASTDRTISRVCSICLKNAYGVMKACQCGDPACDKRAHANCLPKHASLSSVSHPGSSIPQLPTILCQNNVA